MMFLEFAIWGAWSPVLATRLLGPLKFSGKQTGWIYGTIPLACIISPLIAGQIADRWVATEYILAVSHLVGAVFLFIAAKKKIFKNLFGVMLIYALFYTATLPLVNSLMINTMDEMLPLKKDFDYAFVGLLFTEEHRDVPGGLHSVEELHVMARQIFDKAVGEYGFKADEIYFDSTVFPLAIDMPMRPGTPGYTYRAFETIKKITSDPAMQGVHCSLGVSNCARDLPARKVGICRAYVAKAMEYGLDAGIVNTAHHFGEGEAAPELLELVDAYAKMDGSPEPMMQAMNLMGQFCRDSREPS